MRPHILTSRDAHKLDADRPVWTSSGLESSWIAAPAPCSSGLDLRAAPGQQAGRSFSSMCWEPMVCQERRGRDLPRSLIFVWIASSRKRKHEDVQNHWNPSRHDPPAAVSTTTVCPVLCEGSCGEPEAARTARTESFKRPDSVRCWWNQQLYTSARQVCDELTNNSSGLLQTTHVYPESREC